MNLEEAVQALNAIIDDGVFAVYFNAVKVTEAILIGDDIMAIRLDGHEEFTVFYHDRESLCIVVKELDHDEGSATQKHHRSSELH